MEIKFDFTEINRMADRYEAGTRIVNEEVRKGMTLAVVSIEADAKRRVPTDTRGTFNSITHEVVDNGRNVVGRAGTNITTGDGKSLGQLIEDGRSPGKMPPAGALLPWMSRHPHPNGLGTLNKKTGYYSGEYVLARAINKRKRPHPFMKPAYDINRLKISREFGTSTPQRIIDRLAAKA